MKTKLQRVFLFFSFLISFSALAAQTLDESGIEVLVKIDNVASEWQQGTLVKVNEDSLVLRSARDNTAISLACSSIKKIEVVSVKRNLRTPGIVVGFLSAAIISFAIASKFDCGEDCPAAQGGGFVALPVGLAAAVVGGHLGSRAYVERWVEVQYNDLFDEKVLNYKLQVKNPWIVRTKLGFHQTKHEDKENGFTLGFEVARRLKPFLVVDMGLTQGFSQELFSSLDVGFELHLLPRRKETFFIGAGGGLMGEDFFNSLFQKPSFTLSGHYFLKGGMEITSDRSHRARIAVQFGGHKHLNTVNKSIFSGPVMLMIEWMYLF